MTGREKARIPYLELGTDSEFKPVLNASTVPICLTIQDNEQSRFYVSPNASERVLLKAKEVGHKIFQKDFTILDFLEDVYGYATKKIDNKKYKNSKLIDIVIFYSFKDLEFLFKHISDYKKYILDNLTRTRRLNLNTEYYTENGIFSGDTVKLPYLVQMPDKQNNGKMRWFQLSVKVSDICAMQGNTSLKEYANNVGLEMLEKDTYNSLEKRIMEDMYCDDPFKMERYCNGDGILSEVRKKTNEFYNNIAELIGIETRKTWGMSTGKIVATILNDWLCKNVGVTPEQLYKMHSLAGSEGITNVSKILKCKDLIYGAMVDGGRAVKERINSLYGGTLIDIDIDGCYGNGLKNQKYAIGRPTIDRTRKTLREWEEKYKNELIPGLWYARISWKNAPFKQDILISKTNEKFSTWNWTVEGFDKDGWSINDDNKKVYDAAMALTTNSVHYASLNHDLLQTIKNVSSNQELGWLLDNAYIDCSLVYKKSDRVNEPTEEMLEGVDVSEDDNVLLKSSCKWIEINLKGLVDTLLKERKKYKKKTPMNTFLKLIINTIYGCIASEFFSVKGACVSSVVIGNNITARARCLTWCMAKGFHSAMSITDGGVFDVNKVLEFKKKSLNLLEGLHRDRLIENSRNNRHIFAVQKPLLGYELDFKDKCAHKKIIKTFGNTKELVNIIKSRDNDTTIKDCVHKYCLGIIDKLAWKHLTNIFDIDIFSQNQFSFDSKNHYIKLILHSKVDYLLETIDGKKVVAFRGMDKIYNPIKDKKEINPIAYELFDAIERNEPILKEIDSERMLSLKDYREAIRMNPDYDLLPHDIVEQKKFFYSIVPLDLRHKDIEVFKKCKQEYQKVKDKLDPDGVAKIRDKYLRSFEDE